MKTNLNALPSIIPANESKTSPATPNERSTKGHNRRRSNRRPFNALIRVYGSAEGGKSFYEEARTINVSTHGALLEINIMARVGQKLMLINEATQRQQICKIVNIRSQDTEALLIAVEFPVPHAEFWHVFSPLRTARSSEKQAVPAMNETEMLVCV